MCTNSKSVPSKHTDISKPLQVLYTNCDQLLNKFDELLTIVGNDKPDLMLLTEVIPKAQTLPIGVSRISIAGYHLFTNFDADLSDLGKSGCRGVAIYVAECLHPFQVSYPSGLNEHLWINISLDNTENLFVGNIYCCSSSDKFASTNDPCNLFNQVCNTIPVGCWRL